MKKIMLILGLIFILNQSFGQTVNFPTPPIDYDWKETVDVLTTRDVFYDESILAEIPSSAMFWVEIQGRNQKIRNTTYVMNDIGIYERTEKISTVINGKPFNHGLSDMIIANNQMIVSTLAEPSSYYIDINSSSYDFTPDTLDLALTFDINAIKNAYFNEGLLNLPTEGVNNYLFRDTENGFEILLKIDSNTIIERNLEDNSTFETQYDEGYCVQERITTVYDNYSFDIRINQQQDRKKQVNNSITDEIKLHQNGKELTVLFANNNLKQINIYDMLGRIVLSEDNYQNHEFIFRFSQSGMYLIEILQDGNRFTNKIIIE